MKSTGWNGIRRNSPAGGIGASYNGSEKPFKVWRAHAAANSGPRPESIAPIKSFYPPAGGQNDASSKAQ